MRSLPPISSAHGSASAEAGAWRRPGEERFSALPPKNQVPRSVRLLHGLALCLAGVAVVLGWVAVGWGLVNGLKALSRPDLIPAVLIVYACGTGALTRYGKL